MKSKICCILITLISLCIIYLRITNISKFDSFIVENDIKYVDSDILVDKVVYTNVSEELIETNVSETSNNELVVNKNEVYIEESKQEVVDESQNTSVSQSAPVVNQNEVLVGKMSGYGPDCYGCSGYLASGTYVGDGNIYYNDSEYGQVRIVAGDKKYKFGTIVKINDSMLAIVLDRGGSIGIGKKFLFDLLYSSEAEANGYGVSSGTKFEILRNGFN